MQGIIRLTKLLFWKSIKWSKGGPNLITDMTRYRMYGDLWLGGTAQNSLCNKSQRYWSHGACKPLFPRTLPCCCRDIVFLKAQPGSNNIKSALFIQYYNSHSTSADTAADAEPAASTVAVQLILDPSSSTVSVMESARATSNRSSYRNPCCPFHAVNILVDRPPVYRVLPLATSTRGEGNPPLTTHHSGRGMCSSNFTWSTRTVCKFLNPVTSLCEMTTSWTDAGINRNEKYVEIFALGETKNVTMEQPQSMMKKESYIPIKHKSFRTTRAFLSVGSRGKFTT